MLGQPLCHRLRGHRRRTGFEGPRGTNGERLCVLDFMLIALLSLKPKFFHGWPSMRAHNFVLAGSKYTFLDPL